MPPDARDKPRDRKQRPPSVRIPFGNSSEKAVIATDLSGTVVFWNRAAEQLYGWSWQEVIGRPITDLIVADSSQTEAETIMTQLRQGKSWTGEFRVRRRDGSEFMVAVTDEPMLDNAGNLVGIIGMSHAVEPLPAAIG